MSPASANRDSMQLLSLNRSQIIKARNTQYLITSSERSSSPRSSKSKSRTPFDKTEPLCEENLSAGVEYQGGGFGIKLLEANRLDQSVGEIDMLKAELARRKEMQAERDREMQDMLESKLESSKEEVELAQKLETEPNLRTTGGTVETEAPAEENAEEVPVVWCCGKHKRCELQ